MATGAVVVLCVPLLLYDPHAMYEQVIGFLIAKHEAYQLHREENFRHAVDEVVGNPGLALTALLGLVLVARRNRIAAVWVIAWVVAALAAIVEQTPLFWRHFVLLAPPLALLAGAAPALILRRRCAQFVAVLAVIALCSLPDALPSRKPAHWYPWLPANVENEKGLESLRATARWIQQRTGRTELVGGDDPMAVYLAGREAPPELCDTSHARISSGSLTLEKATAASAAARLIVLRQAGRLASLSGFHEWLRSNYHKTADKDLAPRRTAWLRNESGTAADRGASSRVSAGAPRMRRRATP